MTATRTFLAMCSAACIAGTASAQDAPRIFAAATGTSISTTSVLANGSAQLTGRLYGGEGVLSWNSLFLRLGYAQGSLGFGPSRFNASGDPADGGVVGVLLERIFGPGGGTARPGDLDLVDAYTFVGWNVIDGLELGGGLHGRARIADEESERLLLWVLRARYEAPVISDRVSAFLEGWNSVSGSATAPQGSASGRGGSAGAIASLGPVGLRVAYAVDQARYGDSERRETLEGLSISLGYIVR